MRPSGKGEQPLPDSRPAASPSTAIAPRFLLWLANAIYRHRPWFLYPQLALVLLCLLYAWQNLEFHTARNDLVGGDKLYHQIFLEFRKEFPIQQDLVVVVESEDMEKNRQFVERLGARLTAETNIFAGVFYKGDLASMGPKAMLFLSENAIADLNETLRDYQPVIRQFTQASNLVSLVNLVNTQFRTASSEDSPENRGLLKALPALQRIIDQASAGLLRPGNPPTPGVAALFEGGPEAERQMYVTFNEGRTYLITAQAVSIELDSKAVDRLRELIRETALEVPGVNVGLTGEPVLEYDEMAQSQSDTLVATCVALLAVAIIFIYGYNETGRPLKATLCLLVGLAYTMAFTTAAIGHLNILTITFVPILVGLAIDFGVHLISRYEEELRHGRTQKTALQKAMVNTGMGVFTGALTTAGAFAAMAAADFKGIREMGIICSGGMLVCLVPMLTLLPVLLLRGKQNTLDHELGPVLDRKSELEMNRRARIENIWLQRPVTTICTVIAITAAAALLLPKVRFDYNLLNMQSDGLAAVLYQDKLIESSTRSVLYGAIVANSATEATNLLSQITNLTTVGEVDTMATYLTEDQSHKLRQLEDIKKLSSAFTFRPPDTDPVNIRDLSQALWSLHGYAGLAMREVIETEPELHASLHSLRESVSGLRKRLLLSDWTAAGRKLAYFQLALFNDVRDTFHTMQQQDATGAMTEADLPDMLRHRFIGVTGKHLLQVYPRNNIWEREPQEKFIRQLRSVAPRTTGTPVQLYEYTTLLKDSFEQAAQYSLVAIALLVLVHFRKISCVFLALVPVAIGAVWLVGLMVLFDFPFNPANIMTLPLIIGIGVTSGIHILTRFAEEQHPSILARSTGKAVLVSGLTTISGFGSLCLAEHRGIQSLGYIMSTGVATCLIIALVFLPALLNLLNKRGWNIKKGLEHKKNPARQCTVDTGSGGTEVKTSIVKQD